MALDYSKLSDAELEAIANNDYSKLSDATLQALASEGETKTENPNVNLAPQAISAARGLAGPATDVAKGAYNVVAGSVGDVYNLGKIATQITPAGAADLFGNFVSHPVKTSKELASAYIHGHPWAGSAVNTNLQGVYNAGKGFAGRVGTGLAQGLLAPESLMALPYQAAAYEQEKIRANPNAPEYATNPYAMSYRSQGTATPITQGQAGAMNQRNVIANMPYGNVTPQERAILDQDRLQRNQQQAQARAILAQPPTAQNFIERMKALSSLYSPL